MAELTEKEVVRTIPIVAVRGLVVFPHTEVLLTFGRPRSVSAVKAAFQEDRVIGIFTQKDARVSEPDKEDLYPIGTIATITQIMSSEGEIHALVRGQAKINIEDILAHEPYLVGRVKEKNDPLEKTDKVNAYAKQMVDLFKRGVNLGKSAEITTVMRLVSGQVDPGELVYQVAALLDVKLPEKQQILEIPSLEKKMEKVLNILSQEVNVLEIERTIASKTQKRFEDQMRKAMLREKKKTIEEELGEQEEGPFGGEETGELRRKIKEAGMPKDVRKKADKELDRLSQMSPNNPEGAYIRNYLDWLTEMPWSKLSPNNVSISNAEKILNEEHYGIEKAKQRIVEFLAVMKIKSENEKKRKKETDPTKKEIGQVSHPTILCFIGPPGVGKTSIGKSIAKALNRKFVRVSLGGIRDEAEIRGHRRTYVGALPGRIIQGIRDAGTRNPVFMLDEVDKLGTDFRGDPSSALLEALDPEQNKGFSDHYLEVPFDLSEVMFICTGNMLEGIPPALRDRMEVIKFPGYTEEEKYHIAAKYLWSKQLAVHALEKTGIKMDEKAFYEVINRYTREAGVRNLERNLASICRKIARMVAEKKEYPKKITVNDVHKFLGPQQFSSVIAERKDEVGMATGLAVTPGGGEILFIEVALMPGKGKLTLTGQLGSVMKESARAAFTWARAHWKELGLKEDFALNLDVHVHVPEGAVPKDGPSAGIALATALVSALTGIPVRREVGMTGELTLRGRVLEIGGVKEKVIAGHRAGLKTIILPKDNKKDMEDVPQKVKKDIQFLFANDLEEVLKTTLKENAFKTPLNKRTTPNPRFIAAA